MKRTILAIIGVIAFSIVTGFVVGSVAFGSSGYRWPKDAGDSFGPAFQNDEQVNYSLGR